MNLQSAAASLSSLFAFAPPWAIGLMELLLFLAIALVVHAVLYRIAARLVASRDLLWRSLVKRTAGPARLTAIVLALVFAAAIAPLTYTQSLYLQRILLLCVIGLVAWIAWTALNIWLTVYLRRFTQEADDSFLARKHVTQTHILRRVAGFVIWLTALAAGLMTFDSVRQYGVSLLASAGAAGVIVGLALQPVLKNLIAGIQIAITQPIRIGDSLIVESDFGTVEDIKSTYVVVCTWDLRRLVMPLSYFIEQPFQNWTRESTSLLGYVLIYLDYSVPVEDLRDKAKAIAEASPLWDKAVFAVQVTDFRETTMEVRVLVSARNAPQTFDLRCEMREKLIAWLREAHPAALPRVRAHVDEPAQEIAPAVAATAAQAAGQHA